MLKIILENLKKIIVEVLRKAGFSDFKVVDKSSCYVTKVAFHDSKYNK